MATQEKTWNVANRLHSLKDSDNPEVNHIIAGADEIYDDTKGAKQSDINAQTDAALADRYTKSETYSKEQLDSLITTPDANYVSVATFADLPQTGEANTIYRVSSYDGTQVDASKYALYAWNGATYQLLAVRSAVGEVFDVSEYNSGATYETLAAALAAVPASVQKGGMSIKFILRTNTGTEEEPVYHDEYVQYLLKNTAWSITQSDWESTDGNNTIHINDAQQLTDTQKAQALANMGINGIDDEPTAGSDNPVKSGGVQKELALGTVYDVSAKNPTAGPNNDGKFESLSALLSDTNLNTLIPTAYRKGGMSIKFVQSSDNKYVQYFLTKNTWSVSEGDWEKMNLEEEVSQLGQELSIEIAKLNSAPNTKQVEIVATSAQNTRMTLLSGEKYLIQCSCPGADNATLNDSGLYYNYGSGYIKAFAADKSMFNRGFTCVLIPSNDTNLYVRTQTIGDVVDITLWNITNIEEKASKRESIFAAIASEAYSYSNLTYNDSGMPISGNIVWPDGRTGGIAFYYDNSGVLFTIQYTISGEKYRQEFSYRDDGSFAANTIYKVNN